MNYTSLFSLVIYKYTILIKWIGEVPRYSENKKAKGVQYVLY